MRGELLTKDKALKEACDIAIYLLTRVRESESRTKEIEEETSRRS